MVNEIEERKEKLKNFFKEKYDWLVYVALAFVVFIATYIRTRNLDGLRDVTTGGWTLAQDLDPYLFLRWAKEIVATGTLQVIDHMRYVPKGFNTSSELILPSYFIAWFHKLAVFFGSTSVEQSAAIFPVFMFALTVIAFFFLVREIFLGSLGKLNSGIIAIISSFFLSVIPALLPRTIAGIPEKEASGFLFMFLAFYFFLSSWKSDSNWKRVTFALLAGISTAIMALIWGGVVYIFLVIALASLLALVFGQADKNKLLIYGTWLMSSFLIMRLFSTRYSLSTLLTSTTTLIPFAIFAILIIHVILTETRVKQYLQYGFLKEIPEPVTTIVITALIGIIFSTLFFGPSYISDKISDIAQPLIVPVTDRLGVTVAENRQPFFGEWADSFGPSIHDAILIITNGHLDIQGRAGDFLSNIPLFFIIFLIGSIFMYKFMIQSLDLKERTTSTIAYAIFLFSIIFSRYSSSFLTPNSGALSARNLYLFSWIVLFSILIYLFYKYSKENKIKGYNWAIFLLLTPFLIVLLSILMRGNEKESLLLNGQNPISLFVYLLGVLIWMFFLAKKGLEKFNLSQTYFVVAGISVISLLLKFFIFKTSSIFVGITLIICIFFLLFSIYGISNQQSFKELDFSLVLLFSLFFLSIISARGSVRTIMVLVPAASIMAAYLLVPVFKSLNKIDYNKYLKLLMQLVAVILVVGLVSSSIGFINQSVLIAENNVKSPIPGGQMTLDIVYAQQWQKAMAWVREYTPKDAVFAHWWDYGYWVQTLGERATVLDGGNAIAYWDYLMGRHALTGQSNQEALEFLYSHNVTHFLIDSTDIGKYQAFSSIGSDENYDRFSSINAFTRADSETLETKTSVKSVYYPGGQKGSILQIDSDIKYDMNGTQLILPAGKAGIIAIVVEKNSSGLMQSQGVFYYQNNQYLLPLRYGYSSSLVDFGSGIESGIFLFPIATQTSIIPDGALLFLGSRTVNSQLARLYLFNEQNPYFKLVKSQDNEIVERIKSSSSSKDDFVYFGGIQGPIKIWEVSYPAGMKVNPEYLQTGYPNPNLSIAR